MFPTCGGKKFVYCAGWTRYQRAIWGCPSVGLDPLNIPSGEIWRTLSSWSSSPGQHVSDGGWKKSLRAFMVTLQQSRIRPTFQCNDGPSLDHSSVSIWTWNISGEQCIFSRRRLIILSEQLMDSLFHILTFQGYSGKRKCRAYSLPTQTSSRFRK